MCLLLPMPRQHHLYYSQRYVGDMRSVLLCTAGFQVKYPLSSSEGAYTVEWEDSGSLTKATPPPPRLEELTLSVPCLSAMLLSSLCLLTYLLPRITQEVDTLVTFILRLGKWNQERGKYCLKSNSE